LAEKPQVERLAKDVWLYDSEKNEWVKGYRSDVVRLPKVYELQWTAVGVKTDVAPDRDEEIDVEKARDIAIQADTTHASNTSSSIDVNVECELGNGKWDTIPYAEMNLGDNEIKTMLISAGPFKIRLRVDNNTAASTGYVKATVKVRE